MNVSEALVIHMADPTTDFLKPIYRDLDCEVFTESIDRAELNRKISAARRVLMLGHGSPGGLFGTSGMVIDYEVADFLRGNPRNVHIWCHADEFVKAHGLRGFSTGMFISEAKEAVLCDVEATEEQIEFSNDLFVAIVREAIRKPMGHLLGIVREKYNPRLYPDNRVIAYNAAKMHLF